MTSPYFDIPRFGAAQPFIIAGQGHLQDQMIIGPKLFTQDQQTFFQWLLAEIPPGSRRSAFRLGVFNGARIAARIYPVDTVEGASGRKDGMLIIGMASRHASPASLAECLGLASLPIAHMIAEGRYAPREADEQQVFNGLAHFVAGVDLDHDWSGAAFQACDECQRIPGYRLLGSGKRWRKRSVFGALLREDAPVSLKYRIAGELWRRHRRRDLTILLADDLRGGTLFFDADFSDNAPLVMMNVSEIRLKNEIVDFLTVD